MRTIDYHSLPAFKCYFRPKTVDEAIGILSQYGEEARILAGGTDLLVLMRSRKITPKYLIDINGIPELDGIHLVDDHLRIGALARLSSVESSPIVQKDFPILHEAIGLMASIKIRNAGTVVGNLCLASPSADTAPPLMVLNALVEIAGPQESRLIYLENFFGGPGITILKPSEMVTGIRVSRIPETAGAAFLRITRVAADVAKVNAAAILNLNDGIWSEARIALGGVGPTPIRAWEAEDFLGGKAPDEGVIEKAAWLAASEGQPSSDVRSPEEYRKDLSQALVSQTLRMCLKRIKKNIL